MKYDQEKTKKLTKMYSEGISVPEIAKAFSAEYGEQVPDRSIISKLSSLGIYTKKTYVTKQGEVPIKKEEYILRLADLLGVHVDLLESLEKVNKPILALLERKLAKSDPKPNIFE